MSNIEQKVMANVALIYSLRKLMSKTAVEFYVFVACLWAVGQLVWVSKVFENLAKVGPADSAQFLIAALLHTQVLVQLVVATGALAAILFLVDFLRPTAPSRSFA